MGEEGEQDKGGWVQVRVFEQNSLGRHKGVETQRLPRCPRTQEDEANYLQLAAFVDIEQFYYEGEVKSEIPAIRNASKIKTEAKIKPTAQLERLALLRKDQDKDEANTTSRTPGPSAG